MLTVHALELRMPVREVMTAYKERPQGSLSKLSTFRDGFRILRAIFRLAKEERPLAFFSAGGAALATVSVTLAFPLLRSEEHTSELQSLMRISSAVFCLQKK